jgi:hypothetical protein
MTAFSADVAALDVRPPASASGRWRPVVTAIAHNDTQELRGIRSTCRTSLGAGRSSTRQASATVRDAAATSSKRARKRRIISIPQSGRLILRDIRAKLREAEREGALARTVLQPGSAPDLGLIDLERW